MSLTALYERVGKYVAVISRLSSQQARCAALLQGTYDSVVFTGVFFSTRRFFRASEVDFRADALTARFFRGADAARASAAWMADIHLGGLPRRLPRLPAARRSMAVMVSSICCRSARSCASILRMSIVENQYDTYGWSGWPDAEICAIGMVKDQSAYAGFRLHHHALGELYTDVFRPQQLPEPLLIV